MWEKVTREKLASSDSQDGYQSGYQPHVALLNFNDPLGAGIYLSYCRRCNVATRWLKRVVSKFQIQRKVTKSAVTPTQQIMQLYDLRGDWSDLYDWMRHETIPHWFLRAEGQRITNTGEDFYLLFMKDTGWFSCG